MLVLPCYLSPVVDHELSTVGCSPPKVNMHKQTQGKYPKLLLYIFLGTPHPGVDNRDNYCCVEIITVI